MSVRVATRTRDAIALARGMLFIGGRLMIRSGPQPSGPNGVASGVLLATVELPASPWMPPAGGVLSKAGRWFGTIEASGTAGWWRLQSRDRLHRIDGAVGDTLTLNSVALTEGEVLEILNFSLTEPG